MPCSKFAIIVLVGALTACSRQLNNLLCSTGACGTTFDSDQSGGDDSWIGKEIHKRIITKETTTLGNADTCQATKLSPVQIDHSIESDLIIKLGSDPGIIARAKSIGFECHNITCKYKYITWNIMRHSAGSPMNNLKVYVVYDICVRDLNGHVYAVASTSAHT